MADTGWTCSACGTQNEPGARACAGCGRWPSVFDLEDASGKYRTDREATVAGAAEDEVELGELEHDGETEDDDEDEPSEKGFRWGPVVTFAIAAVFILVSWLSDRLGS